MPESSSPQTRRNRPATSLRCVCKPHGQVHAWEPGESCSPERVDPRISMGLTSANVAWVAVKATNTEYGATPRERKHEYVASDYDVTLVRGRDVLNHDDVRSYAHDAFLDAYGAN